MDGVVLRMAPFNVEDHDSPFGTPKEFPAVPAEHPNAAATPARVAGCGSL